MITQKLLKQPEKLDERNLNQAGHLFTFLNPVSYLQARTNFISYQNYDFLLSDGWLFVAALKSIGIETSRYSFDMTSLAPIVFNKAIEQNKSIYFLGAKSEEIEKFIKVIRNNFPKLNILGYRNGYFKDETERTTFVQELKTLSPDIVVAGLGVLLQEQFLVDLKTAGWNGCGYTCGGFIHQTSKGLYFYPYWINKFHLRMPYRFIKEPHFRKRIPDYFRFFFAFFNEYVKSLQNRRSLG